MHRQDDGDSYHGKHRVEDRPLGFEAGGAISDRIRTEQALMNLVQGDTARGESGNDRFSRP